MVVGNHGYWAVIRIQEVNQGLLALRLVKMKKTQKHKILSAANWKQSLGSMLDHYSDQCLLQSSPAHVQPACGPGWPEEAYDEHRCVFIKLFLNFEVIAFSFPGAPTRTNKILRKHTSDQRRSWKKENQTEEIINFLTEWMHGFDYNHLFCMAQETHLDVYRHWRHADE